MFVMEVKAQVSVILILEELVTNEGDIITLHGVITHLERALATLRKLVIILYILF